MQVHVQGVHSALFTPRFADGSLNREVLRTCAEFLMGTGVDGLVLGGATGEYLHGRQGEFREIVEIVSAITGRGQFIAGIGGTDVSTSIENGRLAMEYGARALLLPAPHFFRYAQEDIVAYVQHISESVEAPILLYNLPQFANGFDTATSMDLIRPERGIIGIKDSSGSLETLRSLTARKTPGVSRIVGNDQVLVQARKDQICDGVISGVAAAIPELILYLGRTDPASDAARFGAVSGMLDELVDQLNNFPVPWGLKFISERRGLGPLGSPLPVTESRREQARALAIWVEDWWDRMNALVPVGPLAVAGCVA